MPDIQPFFHAATDFVTYLHNYDQIERQDQNRKALITAYRALDGAIPHAGVLFLQSRAYYYSFHPREHTLLWFQPLDVISDGTTPTPLTPNPAQG